MGILRRRRSPRYQCDKHIEQAYELLHEAIRELKAAHNHAAQMGQPELADRLWNWGDNYLGSFTGKLNDYLEQRAPLPDAYEDRMRP